MSEVRGMPAGALFNTLPTSDVVTSVVRRLRAEIGLGLLADGDPLPKESDLAVRLGVTKFALREALSRLRDDRLIVTRPGKHGGSFVTRGPSIDSIVRSELCAMSITELRDLSDWRRMILTTSARLAAGRVARFSGVRLKALADAVGTGSSEADLRRAFSRFHIELAAAAQSARMSRAALALHEDFDWLFSVVLSQEGERRKITEHLSQIADAVVAGHGAAAVTATETYCGLATELLLRERLAAVADQALLVTPAVDFASRGLAAEFDRMTTEILARLEVLADVTRAVLNQSPPETTLRSLLGQAIRTELINVRSPVDGLGFLAESDAVPERPMWVEWWHQRPGDPEPDTRHDLDPSHDEFYNYSTRDAFARPRTSHGSWAEGPYFDHDGVNDYVVTLSVPVIAGDRFLGVTAADLLVADLERHLAPWLVAPGAVRSVIDAENRVVLSNSPSVMVGDRLIDTDATPTPLASFGWAVVETAH